MPSQGPNNPTAAVDDSSIGTIAWVSPTNVFTLNAVFATALMGAFNTSHYCKATAFNFSIPAGSIINGIQFDCARSFSLSAGGQLQDTSARVVKNGVISGTDLSTGDIWPAATTYKTFGGSNQLWGLSWTAADINAGSMGFVISCIETGGGSIRGRIDHIRATVFYTVAPNLMYPFWKFKQT